MRRSWPDLPGISVWAWPPERGLRIRIEQHPPGPARPEVSARIESEWARQSAANPRLFDGPVLSVVRMEPGEDIRVRRDSYKRLAVQPAVETGVEQLSVTGVVLCRDAAGTDRVFVGRRSRQTRIYGDMWELGPSGGVDPPSWNRAELAEADLIFQLQREFAEETGYAAPLSDIRAHAICQDQVARSCDIVFVCRVDDPGPSPAADAERWEYDRFQWIPLASIPELYQLHGGQIIPPTRALFRFFGWL